MKTKNALLLLLALTIGILSGCSESKPSTDAGGDKQAPTGVKKGGTLVIGANGDPQTFNPDARGDDYFYPIAQNVFSRLIKINQDQQIIPDLAKDWKVSEDGKEITFNLKENVKWHDGKKFTSADVKFTLDSIKKNKGYAASNLSSMQEVSTPDDKTVVIKLSRSDATFLGYLAWYATFIMPEHIYSGDNWDSGIKIKPVGTGPFKFVDYTTGVRVNLERNPDYFGQVPYVDKAVFSIMKDPNTMAQSFYNGELDIFGGSPPSSEIKKMIDDPKVLVKPKLWPSRNYIVFNFNEKPFDKLEVRQAVAFALNNEEIVTKAMKGQGQAAKTFISPVFDWALAKEYPVPGYDPQKAKQLLEKAGYTPDDKGVYLSIPFDVFQSGPFVDIATVVKDQLKQVGINVTLNVMDYAAWQKNVKEGHKFKMSMLGGYQGPDVGAVQLRIASDGSNNFMGFSNPELDKALTEGSQLVKQEERAAKYRDVQRILSKELPIFPITEWLGVYPVRSYVKGDPTSNEAIKFTGFSEYNYVWLDK